MDITSGNFVFSRHGKLPDRRRQDHAACARCVADRQRSGGAEVREHGGQRSAARRRHRHLRQGRTERSGGRRHPDSEDRPHDGGGHGRVSELERSTKLRKMAVKRWRWQAGRDRRRVHARGGRGVFRRRPHARGGKPEAGRLARRGHSRAGGPTYRLFANLRPVSRRDRRDGPLRSGSGARSPREDPFAGLPEPEELGTPPSCWRCMTRHRRAGDRLEDRAGARGRRYRAYPPIRAFENSEGASFDSYPARARSPIPAVFPVRTALRVAA